MFNYCLSAISELLLRILLVSLAGEEGEQGQRQVQVFFHEWKSGVYFVWLSRHQCKGTSAWSKSIAILCQEQQHTKKSSCRGRNCLLPQPAPEL